MKVYTKKRVIESPTEENNFNGYFELEFKEFNDFNNFVGVGSEDFNSKRLKNLNHYEVRVYTGKLNKGGQRTTYVIGGFYLDKKYKPSTAAFLLFGDYARIEKI